jgi:hypothetical protein
MDKSRVLQVLNFYRKALRNFTEKRCDTTVRIGISDNIALGHVLWMFKFIGDRAEANYEGHIGKINRWLGFVQGALWRLGIYSIDELRAHNSTPPACCHVCSQLSSDRICMFLNEALNDFISEGCPPKRCPINIGE